MSGNWAVPLIPSPRCVGSIAEGLSFLGGIDPRKSYPMLNPDFIEDGDRIPIGNFDHQSIDVGRDRWDGEEKENQRLGKTPHEISIKEKRGRRTCNLPPFLDQPIEVLVVYLRSVQSGHKLVTGQCDRPDFSCRLDDPGNGTFGIGTQHKKKGSRLPVTPWNCW